ncbi:MAG: AMP-binding protein [Thermodesulfobacteriota bacterium]
MPVKIIETTPSAYRYPLLIKQLLKNALTHSSGKEIVYGDQVRYDYDTLSRRIAKLANALGDLGVKQGDMVAVMDWDSHRYLECFFAVPAIGAVLHTINTGLAPEQLAYTINHAEDDVILVNADFLPLLEAVKDKLDTVKTFILITDENRAIKSSLAIYAEFEKMIADCHHEYEFPDFDENAMATCFYIVGATGLPKGVCFSHRQVVLHTYGLMSAFCSPRTDMSLDSGDVYMPLAPMHHAHAWGMPYLFTMMASKQVYPGKYEPDALLKLLVKEDVTFSLCAPGIIRMLLNSRAICRTDLSKWKVVVGGVALPEGMCETALEKNINICSAYGMSESGPLLAVSNLKEHMLDWERSKQVSVRCRTGFPAPLVDLEIINPYGKPLPHDGKSVGEVVVRSPWLTLGYLNDSGKSEALWEDGWLHTGDMGFIDSEGYLQITGRIKETR